MVPCQELNLPGAPDGAPVGNIILWAHPMVPREFTLVSIIDYTEGTVAPKPPTVDKRSNIQYPTAHSAIDYTAGETDAPKQPSVDERSDVQFDHHSCHPLVRRLTGFWKNPSLSTTLPGSLTQGFRWNKQSTSTWSIQWELPAP